MHDTKQREVHRARLRETQKKRLQDPMQREAHITRLKKNDKKGYKIQQS